MKTPKSSRANVERRQAKVLTLALRGYSQTTIAKVLHVSQQTISLDLKVVREQITEIREEKRINTVQESYMRTQDKRCELWKMFDATKDPHVKLAVLDRINKLDRELDRFLPKRSASDSTVDQPRYAEELLSQRENDEVKPLDET